MQLNEQKFCGWCGNNVVYQGTWNSKCDSCEYRNYIAPKPGCNVIIKHEDTVLMFERAQEPKKGFYDLPGGFVDVTDSSFEEASYREVNEELGLTKETIGAMSYLGSSTVVYEWDDSSIPMITVHYICEITDPSLIRLNADENASFHWVKPEDFQSINFAWDNDRIMLAKLWNIT